MVCHTMGFVCCVALVSSLVIFGNGQFTPMAQDNLVVILLEGFRWDYLNKQSDDALPAFTYLRNNGAMARWINSVFPSYSCPAWMSMATGLWPENHQIIENVFQDPRTGSIFNIWDQDTTSMPFWWQHAEPIWTTSTRKGIRSAIYSWARCDIPIRGVIPSVCEPFIYHDGWVKLESDLQNAMRNLRLGYRLIMTYTGHIDTIGHDFGPDSTQLNAAVRQLDAVIGRFLNMLRRDPKLNGRTNILVVSGHGMTNTKRNSDVTYYQLIDYVDPLDVELVFDRGVVFTIIPRTGMENKIISSLKTIPRLQAYRKEDIPWTWRYKRGIYVHGILVVPPSGVVIEGLQDPKQIPRDGTGRDWAGLHGYEPMYQDMRGICIGFGPIFKKGVTTRGPLELVDIYALMTNALSISELPNNSSWNRYSAMLKNKATRGECTWVGILYLCFVLLIF